MIVESTFQSVPAVAKEIAPWLPGRLIRHRFANIEKVDKIRSPLLIVHSPEDTLIRYRHGEALFEAAAEPKRFLKILGDHNNGFVLSGAIYRNGWEDFLAPILPRSAAPDQAPSTP